MAPESCFEAPFLCLTFDRHNVCLVDLGRSYSISLRSAATAWPIADSKQFPRVGFFPSGTLVDMATRPLKIPILDIVRPSSYYLNTGDTHNLAAMPRTRAENMINAYVSWLLSTNHHCSFEIGFCRDRRDLVQSTQVIHGYPFRHDGVV